MKKEELANYLLNYAREMLDDYFLNNLEFKFAITQKHAKIIYNRMKEDKDEK